MFEAIPGRISHTPDGVEVEFVRHDDPRAASEPSWSDSWFCPTVPPSGRYNMFYKKPAHHLAGGVGYWVKTSAKCKPAPTCILTTDKAKRKEMPIARGVVDYFPNALAEIAHVSFKANEQHNPGQPMHWARGKSTDHADCIARHLIERGRVDDDGLRHTAKLAWRALALLQEELEAAK